MLITLDLKGVSWEQSEVVVGTFHGRWWSVVVVVVGGGGGVVCGGVWRVVVCGVWWCV